MARYPGVVGRYGRAKAWEFAGLLATGTLLDQADLGEDRLDQLDHPPVV